jgi:hypothetical protein
MMAVADAAQYGTRPPKEVIMAGRIRMYGDPWGGGWMQWPAGLITRLTIAENITNAFQSFVRGTTSGHIGKWQEAHPHEAKIFHEITAMRMRAKADNNG